MCTPPRLLEGHLTWPWCCSPHPRTEANILSDAQVLTPSLCYGPAAPSSLLHAYTLKAFLACGTAAVGQAEFATRDTCVAPPGLGLGW